MSFQSSERLSKHARSIQITPIRVIQFDDCRLDEEIIAFKAELSLPNVCVTKIDEAIRGQFQEWHDYLIAAIASLETGVQKPTPVEFRSISGGTRLCVESVDNRILVRGSCCFPYEKWDRSVLAVIVEQEKPFLWTVNFAYAISLDTIKRIAASLNSMLARSLEPNT